MLQVAGTKPFREYILKRQMMIPEWVDLRPIFEVCAKETVYKEGGTLQELWWRQAAA